MTQAPIELITSGAGLMHLTSHYHLLRCRVALVVQFIMYILLNQPIRIIISNLSENPMHILNKMFVALGLDVAYQIVDLSSTPI